jgi:subtilisin family serine protease
MGNEYKEGNPIEYPCSIDGVVAVGAISQSRHRSSTSNTGRHIALMAPGVNILSTLPLKPSPVRDETEYAAWDGTSMATPFVSGVAALIRARHPKLTAEEVRKRLLSTTTRLPGMHGSKHTNVLGAGLLNARKALQD